MGEEVKPCRKCGSRDRYARGQCIPCTKANSARWVQENRERSRGIKAKWVKSNPEKQSGAVKAWQTKNEARFSETKRQWREANKPALRVLCTNRRRKLAGGKLSAGIAEKLFQLQGGMCPCCKRPLGDDFHLDHIVPIALGGGNVDSNVQLLRAVCNLEKNAKHPIAFMQQRGFLL